jgi:transcriptional regulator with XRE-family HTH domain
MTPEPIYKEIGAIIRTLRRRVDRAQEVLAGQLGISRATLANIETGRQRILVHQLYAIAKALDVKLGDLLPPPRDQDLAANLAQLRIEGDLNPEQKIQVVSLIGTIEKNAMQKAEGADGKEKKRLNRGASGKAAR